MNTTEGQTQRLLAAFYGSPGFEWPMPALNAIGAGPGHEYMNAPSKRISDARKIARQCGHDIVCRNEWKDGQRHTFYTLKLHP